MISLTSTYEPPADMPNFWEFTDLHLAKCCKMLAESRSGPTNAPARAEAVRLLLLWRDAFAERKPGKEEQEAQHWLRAALRKRTIQVMVRVTTQSR